MASLPIIPIYEYHAGNFNWFHYSTDSDVGHGWQFVGKPFHAFGKDEPGVVTFYSFHKDRRPGWKFRYSTDPNVGDGWIPDTPPEAFYAFKSQPDTPETITIYGYHGDDPGSYHFSPDPSVGHGWIPDTPPEAFYAAAPWAPKSPLAKLVWAVGFTYDPVQDIIVSRMDAPQRKFGYAWAYDIAAPTMAMIIDAEPLYFNYAGKDWMIELWKGQYGLECGGEIGIYNRPERILGKHRGWFASADDADRLVMAFTLHRNGNTLLTRGPERHWWLTGFRWGEFSEPEGVTMTASVTLKDAEMCNAFRGALSTCGYRNISVDKTTVTFTFAKPFTKQPAARSLARNLVQDSNRKLVQAYDRAKDAAGLTSNDPNAITAEAFPDAFESIKEWLTSWLGWSR